MVQKRLALFVALCLALLLPQPSAFGKTAVPEEVIHNALLQTCPPLLYPECEFGAEGHEVLGSDQSGDMLRVYLACSVGRYGFFNDAFVMQGGWGGGCTAVLRRDGNGWRLWEMLQVESSLDYPTIMPESCAQKLYQRRDDAAIQQQIARQIQAYLDSIGRDAPILFYGDMELELPNMLTCASNFCLGLWECYPMWIATRECLEDGARFLYTTAWQPDEGGPIDPVYENEHGPMHMSGTTGLATLSKTRKDSGEVLETIRIRVELDSLTFTLEDGGGSAVYAFAFDGQTYRQPVITREGNCGVDTVNLDKALRELPGAVQSQERVEAQMDVSDTARFTILRDGSRHALVYSRLENGEWKRAWRNDTLLPATMQELYLSFSPQGTQPYEYPRFSAMRGDTLSIYAGEEHPDLLISLSRTAADTWQVDSYGWDQWNLYVYLFPDCLLINAGDFSALATAGISFTKAEQSAAALDPWTLFEQKSALRASMRGAPNIEYFAGAEPLYMRLGKDVRCPVHMSPDVSSPRAGNGKAAVSLRDWVIALCREGDWLMVLYETRPGSYRTGWVDATQDAALARACSLTMPAGFTQGQTARLTARAALWDDPLSHASEVCALPAGTQLSVLWEDGLAWGRGDWFDVDAPAYVQVVRNGQTWRGFVARNKLEMP